jgi:hypothetical protein
LKHDLLKEKALSKNLNEQLLETEKALRDEQTKRKLAEDKLIAVISQRQQAQASVSHTTDKDAPILLELANEELTRKELQLRDSKRKSDILEGKGLEKSSKSELQQAQKQLGDALKIISSMLDHQK